MSARITKAANMKKAYKAEQAGIGPADFFMFKEHLKDIDENGSPTQLENALAIDKTDLATKYKGQLWEIQNGRERQKPVHRRTGTKGPCTCKDH